MEAHREDHIQSRTDKEVSKIGLERGLNQGGYAAAGSMQKALPFRLIADFIVEADSAEAFLEQAELTAHQRRLFIVLLTVPTAFRHMCRLAIVSDFETDPGKYFEGEFAGPETEDILACVLPYLSPEDREYWNRLREQSAERLDYYLSPIFMEFRSSFKRVMVQDMTTGETIPARVSTRLRGDA